ncbi:hypothetical protein NDU88_010753 [Pleurodeles waltl]|uniref:Uncharacterized protein n=1 Tax=Pleurodeles waltl TaxID=8319 RepID=A0AAV7S4X2_PLEWA|nr:hypothetical protein NDU88_010753 [Pleurodeles waltl]
MEITCQYVKELNSADSGSKEQTAVGEVRFTKKNVNKFEEGFGKKLVEPGCLPATRGILEWKEWEKQEERLVWMTAGPGVVNINKPA